MKLQLLGVLLICTFRIVKCNEILLPIINRDNKLLEQCLIKISETYFKVKELKLVINLSKYEFNSNLEAIVIGTNFKRRLIQFEFQKIDAYVILLNKELKTAGEQDNFDTTIKLLTKDKTWNPKAKFVIVSDENPEKIFKIFINYFVFNVVVLNKSSENEIKLFSYFPYASLDKNYYKTKPVLVNTCIRGVFQNNNEIFPNKLPKKWINTTLRVALMHYAPYVTGLNPQENGIEIKILKILKNCMGFEVEYVNKKYAHWGRRFPNGTFDEIYGDLQHHKADVGLGFFHTINNEYEYFDMSFSYIEDDLKWIVPRAQPLNHWQNVLLIFTLYTWILLTLFLTLIAFTFYFLSKVIIFQMQRVRSFTYCMLMSFQVLLNNARSFPPQSNSKRLVFVIWCISSCIFSVAFQSKLILAFSVPFYGKQIETLRDMLKSNMKFGFDPVLAIFFENSFDADELFVKNNYIGCAVGTACINMTAFNKKFATIKTKRMAQSLIPLYYIEPNGRSMVYIFESNIVHFPAYMYFARGYPMLEQINDLLITVRSSGFIEYYYKDAENYNRHLWISKKRKMNIDSKPVSYYQLRFNFILLAFGLFLSGVVFLIELALKYYEVSKLSSKDATC